MLVPHPLMLNVPKTKLKTYGDKSFTAIVPKLWNKLPLTLRHAPSIESFKCGLKTYHFKNYYSE